MPAEIDKFGLTKSMKVGVDRALTAIGASADETIIMDGTINYCDVSFIKSSAVAGADDTFSIVSAASIYAKVARDRFMRGLPERYSKYEFVSHVGYGTPLHRKRLAEYGISDIHRRSFAPIRALL
jgi:ribonuclease HII